MNDLKHLEEEAVRKDIRPIPNVRAKNKYGEWVPVIEEPYYLRPFFLDRCRCRCGDKFWGKQRYEEHYALKHILAYEN